MKVIKCPHGNVMYSDSVIQGVRRVHAGIPQCCFEMLCTPAEGEGFIIVDRGGRQKLIHQGNIIDLPPTKLGRPVDKNP
jgi:hypothetical protein